MRRSCERCRGKGHVLEPTALFNVVTAILAAFERRCPEGLSRKECPRCRGKGWPPSEGRPRIGHPPCIMGRGGARRDSDGDGR